MRPGAAPPLVQPRMTAAGDPQVLGRFIVNSWEGAVTRCRVVKTDQPFDDFFVTIFDFLLG
jgi:hypothetical protein